MGLIKDGCENKFFASLLRYLRPLSLIRVLNRSSMMGHYFMLRKN